MSSIDTGSTRIGVPSQEQGWERSADAHAGRDVMEREAAVRARERRVLPAVERERRRREPRPVGQREPPLDRVRELVVGRVALRARARGAREEGEREGTREKRAA